MLKMRMTTPTLFGQYKSSRSGAEIVVTTIVESKVNHVIPGTKFNKSFCLTVIITGR